MIIEIGSYQFLITEIFIAPKNKDQNAEKSYIVLEVSDAPDDIPNKVYKLIEGGSIGRKQNNNIYFSEDLHMSNNHCKIVLVNTKFILEDLSSTNGSWIRLSKESVQSPMFPLHHKTIFKIGNSVMYMAKRLKKQKDCASILEMNSGTQFK